jgi:predicted ATP-dependent serine protease
METSEIMGIYESLVKTHKRNKTGSESSHKSGEEITNKRIHSTLSIQELLLLSDNLKPEFVIDKLIPEKGITYMFGHPGCGKSWLMLEMARAISGGTLFLDTFKTKQQNTMIVDEESGIWEMKRRAELLAINNNLPIFFHCQNGFKFDDDSSVSGLIKLCKEYYITMVIFDPFVAMHSGEENSATEMQKVMDAMQNFTLEGITVLFIHHSRKGGHGNGAQNSRGSSAIHGRADSTLIVEKGTKSGEEFIDVRHTKSRRGKAQEAFRSIVSQPVENGPIELIFDGQTGETVMKRDKARELIMDMLKESSLTRKTIIETISSTSKVGKSNCIAALQELEEGGVISSVLRGREKEYTLPS